MFDIKPITSPKKYDCGATCLKMLLAYYDVDVDLETLIKDCNTTYRGCKATDILAAGRKHGLDMKPWGEKDPDSDDPEDRIVIDAPILSEDRPSIVWWMYGHWVVLCGKDDNGKVVICDPDRGRYRMSEGFFMQCYAGVSITNGVPEEVDPE